MIGLRGRIEGLTAQRKRKDGRPMGPVASYIRRHLGVIERARAEGLSWAEIADAVAQEGVVWRSGRSPSEKDLRTLYARLADTPPVSVPPAQVPVPPAAAKRTVPPRSEAWSALSVAEVDGPLAPTAVAAAPAPPPPASRAKPNYDAEKILREMKRSKGEREPSGRIA